MGAVMSRGIGGISIPPDDGLGGALAVVGKGGTSLKVWAKGGYISQEEIHYAASALLWFPTGSGSGNPGSGTALRPDPRHAGSHVTRPHSFPSRPTPISLV
jgi:hypothetical protein